MPRRLTGSLATSAGDLVTLARLDDWPFFAGVRVHDWPVPDPSGKPAVTVRRIRDQIRRRVAGLIEVNAWGRERGGES